MLKAVDLSVAATVQNTETVLANRRDSGIAGVSAEDGKPRKIKGIHVRANYAGYAVGRIAGEMVWSADLLCLYTNVAPTPCDIEVPAGEVFKLYIVNTASTAVANATVLYEE
jgi:hypothetical protein